MSWEKRNKHSMYFYKKRRVNGKLVREYFGHGPIAQLFAAADQRAAQSRAAEHAELDAMQAESARLDRILDRQEKLLQLLISSQLILAGYYNHKGQWRKRREKLL